ETEAANPADRPALTTVPDSPRGVRRVLDDRQPMPRRYLQDRLHLTGVTTVVQNDDGFRRRSDGRFEIGWRQVEVVSAPDVAEDRPGPRDRDHVRRRDEVQ